MYDIWTDYSRELRTILTTQFSFQVYEDPQIYDENYVEEETQGMIIWNFSTTMVMEEAITPAHRVDFIIRPTSGDTTISGWGGSIRYGINIDLHRDVDPTSTKLQYMLKEIAGLHKRNHKAGAWPKSVGGAKYQPVLRSVANPVALTYQPYSRASLLYSLEYVGCDYPNLDEP